MDKKRIQTTQKDTLDLLLKKHPVAAERIARVDRFPLHEPIEVIVEMTDWRMERHSSKQYPGAASFMLTSED